MQGALKRIYVMYVYLGSDTLIVRRMTFLCKRTLLTDISKDAKDPKLELRFHGTRRACQMGSGSIEPCDNENCYLCCILKNGFSLAHASKY